MLRHFSEGQRQAAPRHLWDTEGHRQSQEISVTNHVDLSPQPALCPSGKAQNFPEEMPAEPMWARKEPPSCQMVLAQMQVRPPESRSPHDPNPLFV